jgi:alpha-beta hydrolase superfamily lysophospholipase
MRDWTKDRGMLQRHEGHFTGQDENELFYQTWSKDESAHGTILITHGLAEHSECYHGLAKVLTENGWYVMALDLRGHGRSEGKRGYVRDFHEYVHDLEDFVRVAKRQPAAPNAPFILFGHSMGGLVTLLYLLESSQAKPDAVVLSSPALGLTVQVPPFKEKVAVLAEKWFPTLTLHNEIKYEDLSRDEKMVQSYPRDNLRQDKVSPGLFLGMQRAFKTVHDSADKFSMPMLVQIAGDDRLVSAEATREFFTHLTNKKSQLLIYPDSYHEIYNDLDRDNVIADLKKFLGGFKRTS